MVKLKNIDIEIEVEASKEYKTPKIKYVCKYPTGTIAILEINSASWVKISVFDTKTKRTYSKNLPIRRWLTNNYTFKNCTVEE